MNKGQTIVVGVGVALLLVLYFVLDTKPEKQKAVEKTRALAAESTDLNALLPAAKASLDAVSAGEIAALEQGLNRSEDDSVRVGLLKQLSGRWYQAGQPAIAGGYAQQVAEQLQTEEAWSIAGTTFAICLQNMQEEKVRTYCTRRAIGAFENAISLNPANIAHRVNLALCYAENPPSENPMQGITMLLELNQQHPDNVLILNSLARLAIKTGQYDRAKERLEAAYAQNAQNSSTVCMLAQVYEALNDQARATTFARQCEQLNNQ